MLMTDRPVEELHAADAFVLTITTRADAYSDTRGPLWHGWAVFDAFLAGVDYARQEQK